MKMLRCKDMGGGTCSFVARGETEDEVMEKMREHHADVYHDTALPEDESANRMREKITETN